MRLNEIKDILLSQNSDDLYTGYTQLVTYIGSFTFSEQ